MGGGDLNLKKSWHTGTFRNQEMVWKREQEVAEETKKLEQLRKELEEERQLQELQRIQEASGGRKRTERLEWMYAAGPGQSAATRSSDLEQYLLGKKRVDDIVDAGHTVDELSERSSAMFQRAMNQQANNTRDTYAKVREDPLFLIKKQEQHSLESIMNNPIKMKQLAEAKKLAKKDKKEKKEKKERKKHHHDNEYSDKESSDKDVVTHYRRRERSNHHRRNDDYVSNSSNGKQSDVDRRDRSYYRDHRHSRSRSPPFSSSRRYRSPDRNNSSNRTTTRDYNHNRHDNTRGHHSKSYSRSAVSVAEERAIKEEERQRRLAAMMENAESLNRERESRVSAILKEEADEEKRDQEDRLKNSGYGTGRDFLSQTNRAVYGTSKSSSLEERVRRNRGNLRHQSVGE